MPVIGVAWKDKPEAARAFLPELGDPYVATGIDDNGRTGIDFGITGVPETFLVDGDGTVLYRFAGPLSPEGCAINWRRRSRRPSSDARSCHAGDAVAGIAPALAQEAQLADPELEQRARDFGREIRCVVCQSQSVADSDADIAQELRVLIREQIAAGKSDQEIRDYLVARYGDFVLFDPPFKGSTYVLWLGPFAILVLRRHRRRDLLPPPRAGPGARARAQRRRAQPGRAAAERAGGPRMILFWIIAGVLTLAAAVVLAAPLFDTRKFKSEDAFALEVYRDQLGELTRDEQRGLLTPEQARAAQIEIERRILALDEGKKFQPARPPSHHLTLAMAVILPLAGFGLYLMLGSPHLPSQSAMERLAEERTRTSPEVQALEAKVEQSPSDAQSWIDLGRAYVDVERAKDAKDAFAKAMALGRKEPDLLRQFAHAAIVAEGGRVTTDAQAALQRVLSADPGDPTSRFFLALAKAQNQDVEGALADWLTLERQLPPEAPLRQLLAENIDKAARQLGKDPAKLPGRAGGSAPARARRTWRRPSR